MSVPVPVPSPVVLALTVILLLTVPAPGRAARGEDPTSQEGQVPAESRPDGGEVLEMPEYPLPRPVAPCIGSACGPVQLVDLLYRGSFGDRGGQRGGFRLRVADRAYLGLEAGAGSTRVTLRSARLEASYVERDAVAGRADAARRIDMVARLPRLRLDLRAAEDRRRGAGGWQLGATAAVRLSPQLEFLVRGDTDTEGAVPPGDPWLRRGGGIGLLWQPGNRLQLEGTVGVDRLATAAGEEIRRWRLETSGVLLREPARLEWGARLLRADGRFERSELDARVGVRLRAWRRLLLALEGREQLELGQAELSRGIELGVTWHGRDYRFRRGGRAAPRMASLVESARALGLEERRVYGVEEVRALRERLAVSPAAARLEPMLEGLYRAVVADRVVPHVGVELRLDRRFDVDLERRGVVAFVAVPWPLRPPWGGEEAEVAFLRLAGAYSELEISPGVTEIGRDWSLQARLHRELLVDVGWARPPRTALELALGTEPPGTWTLGFRYAFER